MQAAVSLRCFDFFYTMYGLRAAGERELANFRALKKLAAQDTRSSPHFAAEIELLYDSVSLLRHRCIAHYCIKEAGHVLHYIHQQVTQSRVRLVKNIISVILVQLVQEDLAYENDFK